MNFLYDADLFEAYKIYLTNSYNYPVNSHLLYQDKARNEEKSSPKHS